MGTTIVGNDTCPECASSKVYPAGDRPGMAKCEECGTILDRYA